MYLDDIAFVLTVLLSVLTDSPLCDVPEFEKSKMTLIRRVPFAD